MKVVSRCVFGTLTVSGIQTVGASHREAHMPSGDAVLLRSEGAYLFYGLADGQSGRCCGAEGGRACLEAIADHIASAGIGNLMETPFPDELPCTFTKIFRKKLLQLSESRAMPLEEFASTLLAVAVDLKTGKYMLLHLGDGCAVSIPVSGEPAMISAPDNGLSLRDTWLTTSGNAVSHFRIRFGSLENRKRLLLLSDGAACFCKGRNILRNARGLLTQGTPAQLEEQLRAGGLADDATCLLLEYHGI